MKSERADDVNGAGFVLAPPDDYESEWIDFGYSGSGLKPRGLHSPPTTHPSTRELLGSRGLGRRRWLVRLGTGWGAGSTSSSARWIRGLRT